jgi:hypothetical protein
MKARSPILASFQALSRVILVCWLLLPIRALANPADYIYTPSVDYGEREVDIKFGAAPASNGLQRAQGASIGLGYGAGEHWFTEVYLKQERLGSQNANLAEWENKFQLTETGEYPVDVGFITEIEAPLSARAAWEIGAGPLLQTEFGKVQLNGNLIFRRAFGKPDETGIPYATNLSYQWQAKYRWTSSLEYGLQGIGGMGRWNNWSSQSSQGHIAGPAIMGKLPLGNRQTLRYNAAWLIGISHAAPNNTFRMQVEYEF